MCNHNEAESENAAVGAGRVGGMAIDSAAPIPAIYAVEVAGELKFGRRQDA